MIVYIDHDCRCYTKPSPGRREVETPVFDGKCAAYIEGYRLVPGGETWTDARGFTFHGEIIAPAEDYGPLAKAQAQYESDEAAYLEELGALIEEIYSEDVERIDGM